MSALQRTSGAVATGVRCWRAAGRQSLATNAAALSAPQRTASTDAAAAAVASSSAAAHVAAGVSTAAAAAPAAASSRPPLPPRPLLNVLSLTLADASRELAALSPPVPRFRAKQLLHGCFVRGAQSLSAEREGELARTMGQATLARLRERFTIQYPHIVQQDVSPLDHTRKFLCAFPSAKQRLAITPAAAAADPSTFSDRVEAVYIPMGASSTWSAPREGAVCVSSQVGCSLSCSFCHTGTMDKRRLRNLTTAEIVGQVLAVKHALGDFEPSKIANQQAAVSNIVFMGMGEPLLNWRNVRGALDVLTDHPRMGGSGLGMGFGRGRVTVSTSGIVPAIDALRESFDGNINLAISLHACRDALRDELVPANRTHKLAALMEACRRYQDGRVVSANGNSSVEERDEHGALSGPSLGGRKRITFEYVMLAGVNDAMSEAMELARLLDGLVALVNLIPFNPWPGSSYVSSSPAHIVAFAAELERLGVHATIRWPRGRDIQGACGQLAIKHEQQQQQQTQQQERTQTQ